MNRYFCISIFVCILSTVSCKQETKQDNVLCACYIFVTSWEKRKYYIEVDRAGYIYTTMGQESDMIEDIIENDKEVYPDNKLFISGKLFYEYNVEYDSLSEFLKTEKFEGMDFPTGHGSLGLNSIEPKTIGKKLTEKDFFEIQKLVNKMKDVDDICFNGWSHDDVGYIIIAVGHDYRFFDYPNEDFELLCKYLIKMSPVEVKFNNVNLQ